MNINNESLILKNTLKKEIRKRQEKIRKLKKQVETLENEIIVFENKNNSKLMTKFKEKLNQFRYSELVSMGIPDRTLNRIKQGEKIKNSTLEKFISIIEKNEK